MSRVANKPSAAAQMAAQAARAAEVRTGPSWAEGIAQSEWDKAQPAAAGWNNNAGKRVLFVEESRPEGIINKPTRFSYEEWMAYRVNNLNDRSRPQDPHF